MERAVKDNRFSDVFNDTRFKPIPNKGRKVKIDKRFQAMFKDSSFKLKYSMDNKGRPSQVTSSEELRKFYHLSSESENDSETETIKKQDSDIATKNEDKTSTGLKESNSFEKEGYSKVESSIKSSDSSDNESPHPSENELAYVGAESGSTTSEESDLEDLDDEFDHQWGELHADAPEIDHPTNRFAICNMDWDRIKAEDLFVLLNSFKPPDKIIHSVKIYPSEFGAQRMKEEEVNGPKELVETSFRSDDNEDDKEEKSVYRREKLRQYQMSRLKYYFAVVECDSPETALILYNELDGMEYESSAACLDLRFVPEDMTFDQEPSSVATSMPNMSTYKPILFTTTAFQQVKVNLTWDETDPRRSEVMKRLFTEDNPNVDISTYLASSSEDEGIEENSDENSVSKGKVKDKVSKYKELLQNIENEKEKDRGDVELEISWEPGLRKAAEDLVKAKQKKENAKTPWEQYLEKRKERKKQKKKQSLQDDQSSDSSEDSEDEIVSKPLSKKGMKKVPEDEETDTKEREMLELLTGEDRSVIKENKTAEKRKKKFEKTKKQDDFKVDVQDPRFSAIYTNSLYNIDPSDSHYKKTEGMKAFVEQKQCHLKSGKYEDGDKARDISSQETRSLAASIKTKLLKAKKRKLET